MNKNKRATGLIELDICLNGGLPIGRLIHIYGASSIGKSTLIYQMLAECGKYSCLIDTESCFDKRYAKKQGVALHNLFIAEMHSSTNIFRFLKKTIESNVFRYIVIDSIAGLPVKDIYAHIASELPDIIKELEKHDTILIFANQIRAKGKKTKPAHGSMINALSSVVLEVCDKHKTKEGYESTIKVIKNKYGMPLGEAKLKLRGVQ